MLFHAISFQALLVTLLSLCISAYAGPCMPCQASNRRDTPWDSRGHHALSNRSGFSPKITNPTNGTIWNTGSDVVVTWDLRNMPTKTSNAKGTLLLGYLEDGSDDEHLNIERPLASNFDLKNGYVTFRCPPVDTRRDYITVLFGDSGNRSPRFSIVNMDD
ncbi:hypothetical protein D9619_007408 [Psilocybe cf. subviscida]|uniref:Uncharacterized protein n=1 Tax=Psilocybe cf. subviscida TaxID=2480587 RepID=A0A8H5B3M1_9AGAR|nr:hypothetical protein D9619_007408 [Psilocybe cf. subviscida]